MVKLPKVPATSQGSSAGKFYIIPCEEEEDDDEEE